MPNYRRNRLPGGTYFFTVNLHNRQHRLLTDHIDILKQALRDTKAQSPFHIDACVVLPDHLHTVWTLPEGDERYAERWRRIKTLFSRRLKARLDWKNGLPIWQRRYWEHTLRDERDYRAHVDYCHINPVKHGWVDRVEAWPHSTFHRYVEKGVYSRNWAGHPGLGNMITVGE